MTKNEVINIIKENMWGCYTCVYSCDEQGYNSAYSACPVELLFAEEDTAGGHNPDCLYDEGWTLGSYEHITNEDIDIDEWAQEFDDDTIEQLRRDIDDGIFYKAVFYNDDWGTQEILVWQY